jgi:hypothetical protein
MTSTIPLRKARDRLIDLLALGQTAPLRDLVVANGSDSLVVGYMAEARISIEHSQKGVKYQLYCEGRPVERTAGKPETRLEAEGTGATLVLVTPPIVDDISFQIRAEKDRFGISSLKHTVNVRVGLDTALKAWIEEAEHLNPRTGLPEDSQPRLIDYGLVVGVTIEKPQEGVMYQLIQMIDDRESVISLIPITAKEGDNTIRLRTKQVVTDEMVIRVRATKKFDQDEKNKTQTAVLDVVLPLKVRPNPDVPVSIMPTPIISYQASPILHLTSAQANVQYQVFAHQVRDREFVRTALADKEAIRVSVDGEADVVIRKPAYQAIWTAVPEGFMPLGEPQQGTGGDLDIPLPPLTDDTVVIVQALKQHESDEGWIPSAVQLKQPILILVEPNRQPPLHVEQIYNEQIIFGLEVSGGQSGVFYTFHRMPEDEAIVPPVYFHKRDDQKTYLNKGIDQLALWIDFVVARSSFGDGSTELLAPLLVIDPPRAETRLSVHAMKAQTRVSVLLSQIITLLPPTADNAEPVETEEYDSSSGGAETPNEATSESSLVDGEAASSESSFDETETASELSSAVIETGDIPSTPDESLSAASPPQETEIPSEVAPSMPEEAAPLDSSDEIPPASGSTDVLDTPPDVSSTSDQGQLP